MAKQRVEIDILAKTKESVKNLAKFTAGIYAGVKALQMISRVVKGSMEAYIKYEKATTKLNAALKATGGAVGISTKEMIKYADSLSRATGISEDAVIETEALMVTFTQIGKETFPRAMEAAADMSAMFGQDLSQSAIQLGTALNSPQTGLGRLRRIGISFTEEQKKSVAGFMEQNDIMSAQKVILDELSAEFGGVAKAMGDTTEGQLKKFSNAMQELSAGFGQMTAQLLGPIADKFATFIQDNKSTIVAIFKNIPTIAKEAFQLVVDIIGEALKWDNFKQIIGALWEGFLKTARLVVDALPKMFINFLDFLTKPFQEFGRWMIELFANAWAKIKNAGIEQLNKLLGIVGVNIEKAFVPPVRKFSQVWDDTIAGMAEAGTALISETGEAIKGLAIVAGDTLKGVFAPFDERITQFVTNITTAIDVTKDKAEEIANVLAGGGKGDDTAIAGAASQTEKMLELFRDMESAIEAPMTAIEVLASDTERAADAAAELAGEMAEWAPIASSFHKEMSTALGVLAAQGQAGWEAFETAAKSALSAVLEGLGQQFAVKAMGEFAAFLANPLTNAPNLASSIAWGAASTAAYVAAGAIKSLAKGGEFDTKGPQLLMVGDNPGGVEHVRVTPSGMGQSKIPLKVMIMLDSKTLYSGLHEATENGTVIIAARGVR